MKHSSNCRSYYNYAIGFYVFNSSLSSWYVDKRIVTGISLDTIDEIDLTQHVISQFISISVLPSFVFFGKNNLYIIIVRQHQWNIDIPSVSKS